MTLAVATSATATEPAAPAEWRLVALIRPAVVQTPCGDVSAAARIWLEWIAQATQAALGKLVQRPVDLGIVPAGSSEAADPCAFGFVFTLAQGEGAIALDLPAARALATALDGELAALRGAGSLTEAEAGILEYATLVCIDDVLTRAAPAGTGFAIKAFPPARELAQWPGAAQSVSVSLRLAIAGQSGVCTLWLPASLAGAAATQPPNLPGAPAASGSVQVRLALPPVTLTAEEVASLAPGDVLLLDASDLKSFAADCRLVTTTGWRLCSATLIEDGATMVSVKCGDFDPQPDLCGAASRSVLARPTIGRIELTLDQLRSWQAGATVDLPKDAKAPVRLCIGTQAMSGELVKVQGSVGIRLLATEGKA